MPRTIFEHAVFSLEAVEVTGREGQTAQHMRLRMPDWVCVVALTADRELVLVRQHRTGIDAPLLEPPGGLVDGDEDPIDAARRELREETGYVAPFWEPLGWVHPSPALQDNRCFLYVARDAAVQGPPEPDPFEDITVELHPLSALPDLLLEGAITHAIAVVALQRLLLAERDVGTPRYDSADPFDV